MNEAAGECRSCQYVGSCMESDRGIACREYTPDYKETCRRISEQIKRLNKEAKNGKSKTHDRNLCNRE